MKPFAFNINLMRLLALWPHNKVNKLTIKSVVKHVIIILSVLINAMPVSYSAVKQLNHLDDLTAFLDYIVAVLNVSSMVYMSQCFIKNVATVRELVQEIDIIQVAFNAEENVQETEKKLRTYTKLILVYAFVGELCYALFPLLNISNCNHARSELSKKHEPCALMVRAWHPFDVSGYPALTIVMALQYCVVFIIMIIVLALTMFLVGLLMYAITFIKNCRRYIVQCCNANNNETKRRNVTFCLQYHNAIIDYASKVNSAFNSMMFMYISLTSFEISVLGFEVVMVDNRMDSFRFTLHLFGWLVLLFFICFYGQKLIDESTGIGVDAYSTNWYNSPISIQKDIKLMILRSQKPLTLSAASLKVMSFETYLGVLSTAYTYFTLLLKLKNK